MTNKEKYGDKIIDLATAGIGVFTLKNGEPELCGKIKCEDCDFHKSNSCKTSKYTFLEWLNSEYVEPPIDWSKVPVDTPIWVRDSEEEMWRKRHFAKFKNGIVYTWSGGLTHWTVNSSSDTNDWKMAKLAESEV